MTLPAEFLSEIARLRESGDLPSAMALCEQRLATSPADIFALHLLGQLQHLGGDFEAARKSLSAAWAIDPSATPVAMALVETLNAQGRQSDALDVLRSLSRLRPSDAALQRHIGGLMFRASQWEAAAACFELLRAALPDDVDGLISLGSSLQMLGKLDRAQSLYEQALTIDPTRADAWSNLGTLQQGRKDLPAARVAYQKAIELEAGNAEAVAGLASVLELEGNADQAHDLLLKHVSMAAQNTELSLLVAKLKRRTGDASGAESALRERLAVSTLSHAEISRLSFALGDVLDKQDRFDEAFEQYRRANELKQVRFHRAGHKAFVEHIVSTHAELASSPMQASAVTPGPLFIVGMPRSGTTLIEQMLGCHAQVHAAGERSALPQAVSQLLTSEAKFPFPATLAGVTQEQLDAVASAYRAPLWSEVGDVRYVTDKLPGNFVYLGLLPALFPNARVIHCQRDPMDVALSLYGRDFAFSSLPFSYSLDDIASYYADYRRLMAHWADVNPVPMLNLDYEKLVSEPEQEIRRVCAFLELDFDPAMLDFHTSARVAFTASNEQVRQPVYTSSVGRATRYADALAPLRNTLAQAGWVDER